MLLRRILTAFIFMGLAASALAASDPGAAINALADELLAHMQARSAYVRLQSKLPITTLDPITLERAQEEARFSKRMTQRLSTVSLDKAPHAQWLLAKMLRHAFVVGSYADQNYWLDFAVTPYAVGQDISAGHSILAAQPLKTAAERDNYLRLLDSFDAVLEEMAAKTRGQDKRGIRVPRPAIAGVIATFRGLHASAVGMLLPTKERLVDVPAEEAAKFDIAVRKRITSQIVPSYERIIGLFDDAYASRAPDAVGIGNNPGGKARYRRLITDYTGLNLTPEQIHDIGVQRIADLDQRMQAVRDQLHFNGDREAFDDKLRKDPRFIARSPEDVEKTYLAHIARIEPLIPNYFSTLPKAPYGVHRLAASAEKGMTYGYYDAPTPADPKGYYYYNGSDLDKRSLVNAQHLIYHELMPGHHMQLALQQENTNVHPVLKFLGCDAFTEGWAEYAASLGEEMGLYDDPYSLYGHLAMQAFLASRLVVDTGLNYFSMPLADARTYMKLHTFESDVQIASETLRYSTDIYAQAVSYRLGYEKFWELRHRAEKALGDRFDIRQFHAAVIGSGSMPLDVLDDQVDWFIAQRH